MKKVFYLVTALVIINLSAHADLYLRGGLFYADSGDVSVRSTDSFKSSIDGSVGFNAAVGYQLSYFRLEGELNSVSSDVGTVNTAGITSSGSYGRDSLFANILFEIPATPFFEPYFGVGIGLSNVSLDMQSGFTVGGNEFNFASSEDDTVLSLQLMVGVRFSLADSFSIYAGYRYLSTDAVSINDTDYSVEPDKGSSLFEIGVGFGF